MDNHLRLPAFDNALEKVNRRHGSRERAGRTGTADRSAPKQAPGRLFCGGCV